MMNSISIAHQLHYKDELKNRFNQLLFSYFLDIKKIK